MRFICPNCSQNLLSTPEQAGMAMRCPACNQNVTVPAAPPAQGASQALPGQAPGEYDSFRTAGPQWSDQANVPVLLSGAIGLGITVFVLGMMSLLKGNYIADLFVARGWVPYVLTLFLGWSIGILILKAMRLSKQRKALMVDVLPTSISHDIQADDLVGFLQHLDSIPEQLRDSFMVSRVRRGLAHFRARRSTPEVANMMSSQSEIDYAGIVGSYTLVKAFLWAIPLLGFIGTVIGISSAIGGFAATTDSAADMEALKVAINGVTGGLGVAFDTTLLALVISIMLYFPMSGMQKAEEDLLSRIDEYCNENLLTRLNDAGGMAHVASNTRAIAEALGSAVGSTQEGILSEFVRVQENMAISQQQQLELYERTAESIGGLLDKTQSEAVKAMQENANAALHQFVKMEKTLDALNTILTDLGGKKIVIQQVKRGLFGGKKHIGGMSEDES
ncbi:MAG: biopolymer transport protein ExbB/TolQ/DNA-directed RNA polymerase subunit RPC12/RpoP [Verrucomicrobiales bacterium]|jgi:biopolymer transport protein ExbB/TolQ/DNA-directed RNA polymerase subunit RPC12/RpoP